MGLFDFFKKKTVTNNSTIDNTGTIPNELSIPKPHVMNIAVAGVTFENRQDILKKIYKKVAPFDNILNIEFVGVPFEGELAIEIRINDHLIGYVPKKRLAEFVKHKDYGYKIKGCIVNPFYDDNDKIDGYHAKIRVEFDK